MEKIRGFKVTNGDMACRGFQYEIGKLYEHNGEISLCKEGFHFCLQAQHCFYFYDFNTKNKVFEIEASGNIEHGDDKSVCSKIKLIREIPWDEVLKIANTGANNTGHSNTGHSNTGHKNSGNRNSGDRNSGDRNSGYWNSGYWNSGNMNSGNRNSGDRNSGNCNSGDRNSGDCNSGYRNSGAFCTDSAPILYIFNKPSHMTVKEWEKHPACKLMYNIYTTIWIPGSMMTKEEKELHPNWETTEGYLKTIPMKDAWANFWHNLSNENKSLFTTLPNFDPVIFEEITGIKTI